MPMSVTNEIIQSIKALMTNSNLTDAFYESVLKRLETLGYTVNMVTDSWLIAFNIQKVESHIKNRCNTSSIPDGLLEVAIERVCGEFLFTKKQTGQLDGTFNLEVAVKQIQTGDTNVTFAIGEGSQTPEQRLNNLIAYLMAKGEGDFVCYRKVKW